MRHANEVVSLKNEGHDNRVPIDQYIFKFTRQARDGKVYEEDDYEVTNEIRNTGPPMKQDKGADGDDEEDAGWNWNKSDSYYSEDEEMKTSLMRHQMEQKILKQRQGEILTEEEIEMINQAFAVREQRKAEKLDLDSPKSSKMGSPR